MGEGYRILLRAAPFGVIALIAHRNNFPSLSEIIALWRDTPGNGIAELLAFLVGTVPLAILIRRSWFRSADRWRLKLGENIRPDRSPERVNQLPRLR